MRPPANEPVLEYAPGSPERAELRDEIARQSVTPVVVAPNIEGTARARARGRPFTAPHRHELVLGEAVDATRQDVGDAVRAALDVRPAWSRTSFAERAAIFSRAADLLSTTWRQRLNAATLLGQSKTPHQAEIDAACELCDFLRFNVHFAQQLLETELISSDEERNRFDFRPLEGFVYAVTPFNFTAIAGNLPTAPALLGNVVIWKPSPHALLSAYHFMNLLQEAGLPDGVIQLVPGDAEAITDEVLANPAFCGLSFTGSTAVFRSLFRGIGERLERYRTYPRIVGETGGKDFIVVHPSADVNAVATAIVRGGFEYQGQKCSAASRVYLPRSLASDVERRVAEFASAIRVGDPADFSCFMGAVIARHAYDRITSAIARARADARCRLILGGTASDTEGFFVHPTVFEVSDAKHPLMTDELFGPVVAFYVYDDACFEEVLQLCDETSGYGLTGAVFAQDAAAIALAADRLREAAGNFYINDKPTGAVVGRQPFGGSRLSGTNDKAGSAAFLHRWVSPRVIKENLRPPTDFRYPFLRPEKA